MKTFILFLSLLLPVAANAASYFIDWDAGSDSNNGTSTSTPWKRHPYMTGWAGSYTHTAGDRFIFKGGVTWPATAMPLTITATGSSDSIRDFYGVTNGWGTGRSVFDSEYETNSATIDGSGVTGYLVFSDLEVKRLTCSGNFGTGLFVFGSPVSVTITNCHIHSWRLDNSISADDAHGGLIAAYGGSITTVLENSEVENSSNIDRWNGVAVRLWGVIRNSTIHDNSSAVLFCSDFDQNTIYRIAYPSNSFDGTYHLNGVYHQPSLFSGTNVGYIRNSRFYDMAGGANMIYPNPSSNYINKVYNNVVHGVQGSQGMVEIDPYLKGGDVYVDNNTLIGWTNTLPGIHVVVRSGYAVSKLYIRNNHVVNASSVHDAATNQVTGTFYIGTNILQSSSSALSGGYSISNLYSPTLSSSITVDSGETLDYFSTDTFSVPRPRGYYWDLGAYEFQSGPTNLLLVLTEPTALGYARMDLYRWLTQVRSEGHFIPILVELPRWTGSWVTNDWRLLNLMSNEVSRFNPKAVLIFGRLAPLMTGGNNWDGHGELRRIVTDAWLGCTNVTFTDTDDWGMAGTLLGNPYVLATNVPGDGIPDETYGTFARPVSRIDASGLVSASGNFTSGYLNGQPYQPAIDEGLWLRRYLTNCIAAHRGENTYTETGHIYSSGWLNYSSITSYNTAISWTLGGYGATGPGSGKFRWVYSQIELQDMSTNWISGAGVPLNCLIEINYKSYQYEIANGHGAIQRRLFPGIIDRPFALVAGFCLGSFVGGDAYWVSNPTDRTVADMIRTSATKFGSYQWYPLIGDLTLPIDPVTNTPPRRVRFGTMTVDSVSP